MLLELSGVGLVHQVKDPVGLWGQAVGVPQDESVTIRLQLWLLQREEAVSLVVVAH